MLLALLGGSMVCSVWMANLVWVLLGLNWLLEGRWREKWQMAKENRALHLFAALYLLLAVAMLWTGNTDRGFSVLRSKMPLFFVPLVMLTSRPVTGKARQSILAFYITAVLVVSIIGLVRMITIPHLPYRDAVPYISHIRFSLNCCVVICLCLGGVLRSLRRPAQPVVTVGLTLLMLWMMVFVLLLHSYTAIAVLPVATLVVLLADQRRWVWLILWVLAVGSVALLTAREVKAYYTLSPLAEEPLRPLTAGGRPYEHAGHGVIENGNYIGNYICIEELRNEWNRRSSVNFDTLTSEGFTVESTLVRYLNAVGLTKDSAGVAMLTDAQVHDVEQGVANPVYLSRNPLRKMVYVILLEREFYHHTSVVSGFTMLQRFELWRATVEVIKAHPWFGVGTGDVKDEMHAELERSGSTLSGTSKSPHNEYLSLTATFGLVGFILLLLLFLRTLLVRRPSCSPMMVAWLLAVLISFLTEDTLDTLAGILFCTYFLAFREPPCTNTTPCPTASK